MLFLHGAQLVLWSSVLTVLYLYEVDVTLKYAETVGRCCPLGKVDLLMAGGAMLMCSRSPPVVGMLENITRLAYQAY